MRRGRAGSARGTPSRPGLIALSGRSSRPFSDPCGRGGRWPFGLRPLSALGTTGGVVERLGAVARWAGPGPARGCGRWRRRSTPCSHEARRRGGRARARAADLAHGLKTPLQALWARRTGCARGRRCRRGGTRRLRRAMRRIVRRGAARAPAPPRAGPGPAPTPGAPVPRAFVSVLPPHGPKAPLSTGGIEVPGDLKVRLDEGHLSERWALWPQNRRPGTGMPAIRLMAEVRRQMARGSLGRSMTGGHPREAARGAGRPLRAARQRAARATVFGPRHRPPHRPKRRCGRADRG